MTTFQQARDALDRGDLEQAERIFMGISAETEQAVESAKRVARTTQQTSEINHG